MSDTSGNVGIRIRMQMSEESIRIINAHAERPRKFALALRSGLGQALDETASYIKRTKFTGFRRGTLGGKRDMIAVRTGSLRQSVDSKVDEPDSGWIGVDGGPASQYAAVILGGDAVTIRPRQARHLWIPVGDNVDAGGRMRISPREAMGRRGKRGGRLLSIFKSRRGNLVAVLRDKVPGVRRRGGKLLFVLKDSVTVEGRDALAKGADEMRDRMAEVIGQRINAALTEETA